MIVDWKEKIGFSLQEIADHMGLTRERVRQLLLRDSPRIKAAVKEMKK